MNYTMEIFAPNNLSTKFYEKWVRDTKLSVFLAAPLFWLFSLTCFALIVGISIKLLFIMILPTLWVYFALIYTPLFIRKDYLNNLIEHVLIEDGNITVSTYKWFSNKPIILNFKSSDINFQKIEGIDFFKGKTVYMFNPSYLMDQKIYLIIDFFEDKDSLHNKLNIPS